MNAAPSPARKAAVQVLTQVLGEGRVLSDAMAGLDRLDAPDRAAAKRLAADVLRGLERADRLLKPHLRKRPGLVVMNILRLGTVELASGGAAHGVVNDLVNLTAAGKRTRNFRGLVNAVLRKLSVSAQNDWQNLRIPRLPKWLRAPLVEAWGPQNTAAMERAHFAGAPLDLTAKSDPEALARAVGGNCLPTGSVRLQGGQVSDLPGFAEGAFWVQDAAAALPARLLGDVAGQDVLDICAAPGGKTLQLAAAGARLTALDIAPARLERVRENLARCGLQAKLIAGDALEHQGQYDAILLDAPCSATGTIRRHPDLPHIHQGEKISALIALQSALLDHALTLLKPGGRLVFATCSLIPDEGECQIDAALIRHPDLSLIADLPPGVPDSWRADPGGLRLRPDFLAESGGIDGFYMACLRKG